MPEQALKRWWMRDKTVFGREGRISVIVKLDVTKLWVGATWMDLRDLLPGGKGTFWLFVCPIPFVCVMIGF